MKVMLSYSLKGDKKMMMLHAKKDFARVNTRCCRVLLTKSTTSVNKSKKRVGTPQEFEFVNELCYIIYYILYLFIDFVNRLTHRTCSVNKVLFLGD